MESKGQFLESRTFGPEATSLDSFFQKSKFTGRKLKTSMPFLPGRATLRIVARSAKYKIWMLKKGMQLTAWS